MNLNTTNTAILKIDHAQPHFQLKIRRSSVCIFYSAVFYGAFEGYGFMNRGHP